MLASTKLFSAADGGFRCRLRGYFYYIQLMKNYPFSVELSQRLWDVKYRQSDAHGEREADIRASWRRVSRAIATAEGGERTHWEERFHTLLDGFHFLPGGRILAGAGAGSRVTLFNCFVMGRIDDSIDGIFSALREGALTMQQGGGVGYDFSTLRPRGMEARHANTIASGPVSFMKIWDAMCATLLSTGARRGAMMATLRCDHPDIEEFVHAKRGSSSLSHFNLSVLISDAFMQAVREGREWALVFPTEGTEPSGEVLQRVWSGGRAPVACRVFRRIDARKLWDEILSSSYAAAEPGVLFIDRINRLNNLYYREQITATNPCGEIPLPPYGACNLGSINLVTLVRDPFSAGARLDFEAMERMVDDAVRLLDDVIDVSRFPLPEQEQQAKGSRRIGLGITGLADALLMLGLHYDSDEARSLAARIMRTLLHRAYRASIALAQEKGNFPFFDCEHYLAGEFIATLPADIRSAIAAHGIRNSHLIAIAPTGTISLLANNISSGLEPVFSWEFQRRILGLNGNYETESVSDYAWRLWRENHGDTPLPEHFVTALQLPPQAHIAMQAALQPFVDNAISKTINIPETMPFAAYRAVYDLAYDSGLKGCTTFRPNPATGTLLAQLPAPGPCCTLEREAD
ncbi:MAG TPA: adenosylcobalamin-dependent ribonucleoside-diphosphate reductase [Gammaproteobacteria bacterium]